MYSSGRPVEHVRNDYIEIIKFFEEGWQREKYESVVWMISLGILLEIDDADFDRLVRALDQQQLQDYLIDFLIAYRKPERKISEQVSFRRYYKGAQETTKLPKAQAEQRLKKYLEKEWYDNNNDTYWYNNHMNQHDTYFGYWSFEAGAIAKIMGLDDSSFKDNEYYPCDLVHWKKTRKV